MLRVSYFLFLILFLIPFIPTVTTLAGEEPVKALFILGGEHHPYELGSRMVGDMLQKKMAIEIDYVRIDHPPEGMPRAEKATIASNPDILDDKNLRDKYDIILAYNQEAYTNLTHKQRDGYLHFVRSGGPWVGIHSASDFLKNCPDYVRMVGGKFETHPPFGEMHVKRVIGDHPILEGMDDFTTMDEFYHVADCPLHDKEILLVSQSPKDGKTRPVAWTRRYGKGKVFYTVLGHSKPSFENPDFQKLIYQAVRWALTPDPEVKDGEGWMHLFNGRDQEGWTHCGPGRFDIEDGALKSIDGMGLLWYDRRSFKNFTLSVEWKVGRKEDNSGIFIRFPDPPADEWEPVSTGYEIQICDAAGSKHSTGAVYSFQGPSHIASKPVGEWNLFEITVIGQSYSVKLNGEEIVTGYKGDRGEEGYIGLQNHDPKALVYYRNIKVKEL